VIGETTATSDRRKEGETMSTEASKAFVRSYLEELSGKEKPRALQDEYIAESDEELKEHIVFFEASFPRYALPIDDLIAEGDKVAAHVRFEGKHDGELLGIAPTGKEVSVPFIITYRLAGGKIAEHWMSFDRMALMEQLGVAPT
jgi:predicted ester cyclase